MSIKENKNNYLIYCHTSPSGKKYIGQTNNYNKRCYAHKQESSGCINFLRAIKKYGWDNFSHEILKENLTLEDANYWEEFLIKELNSLVPHGYNLTGGGNNSIISELTKQRMRDSAIGRIFTKETRDKIDATRKGRKHTQETINKISISHIGKVFTPITLARMSESKTGEKHHNFGKFGEDHPASKRYKITYPDGKIEIIKGLNEFCKNNNLNTSHMTSVAQGKPRYRKHKNFICEYYNEEIEKEAA